MPARSLTREFTRPVPRDVRLFQRSSTRMFFAAAMVALAGIVGLVLFAFPINDYFNQREAIAKRESEFVALEDANESLQNDIQRLQTPNGVREAARRELGYLMPGEKRLALLEEPAFPTTLPEAWPYSVVNSILAARSQWAGRGNSPGGLDPLQAP